MEASGFTKSKLYYCHKLLTVPALQQCLYSEMVTAPCEPHRDGPWNITETFRMSSSMGVLPLLNHISTLLGVLAPNQPKEARNSPSIPPASILIWWHYPSFGLRNPEFGNDESGR
jgi:hypothetical protein